MTTGPGRLGGRPATRAAGLIAALAATFVTPAAGGAQHLPVGDGRVSDHPAVGYVYSCRTTFRVGGAAHTGPWFHGDSWNPDEKPRVRGSVLWPDAAFTLTPGEQAVRFEGNGLPVESPTGIFPIARTDPAYRYDTNPNHISAQQLAFEIPANPTPAETPGCLPMGMIGFTVSGVAFYNALDDAGLDAAAHEIQDLCDGHPQSNAQYHYHSGSACIPGAESDALVGWALDGYPILGMKEADGSYVANADLDACHGRREQVTVDGRTYDYAYRLTREYPYTLGCFRGRLIPGTRRAIDEGLDPSARGSRRP